MTDYQNIINQIPIQFNVLSFFVFTGIVLGVMISLTIFFKRTTENKAIQFLGIAILCITLTLVDFFLSQTGLLKYALYLNNSTEAAALLIPICIYFFILEILNPENRAISNFKGHLVFPFFYFLTQIDFFLQPETVQLNSYTNGFHPHLPIIEYEKSILFDIAFTFSRFFHHLLISTFVIYIVLSIQTIRGYNQKIKQHFTRQKSFFHKYNLSIYLTILLASATLITTIIFITYTTDLGEKYLMLIPLTGIFTFSFLMMSGIPIFDKTWLLDKYHTSGLNISSSAILEKIIAYVEGEQYYLKKNSSLKDLGIQLSLSPTYLSQVINSQANQNFNDFINQYRIEEVKKRLTNELFSHLNIAGIGQSVGFKSKSAFYAAFKKHTQFTPTAYIKAMNGNTKK